MAPGDIRGLAVSSALPSLVMVGAQHRPIHNAYNLLDRRAAGGRLAARSRRRRAHRAIDRQPHRRPPVLVNLLWEQRHRLTTTGASGRR